MPKKPEYLFVQSDCATVAPNGGHVVLRRGDCWAADDALVLAQPSLFGVDPPFGFPLRSGS